MLAFLLVAEDDFAVDPAAAAKVARRRRRQPVLDAPRRRRSSGLPTWTADGRSRRRCGGAGRRARAEAEGTRSGRCAWR